MILFSVDLHFNLYDVNLKSQKILALSSVYTLILFNAIFMFLLKIFSLKCFCTTMKDINLYNSPLRVPTQLPHSPNLTILPRGNCWKVCMVFPSLFWQFHPLKELSFAYWHSSGLISMSPTGSCDQNMPFRMMSRNSDSLTEAIFWLFEDSEVMDPFPLVF